MILPIMSLLGILSVFAVIFFSIRWLVRKQWYYFLSVLCAHVVLDYLHRIGWLQWESLEGNLLLVMTLVCSVLILFRLFTIVAEKKKKCTA
ncbi:hypothetical protein [Terribacillus saccharophilus]|uniref:Uncharacterized protein n=1 Tax=Terribacillus saccharophilus TaxID=361277 RepID=A0ABX4H2E9_9BACI|nr:hypothetical protein [Terribacillus saccharophilus]PAD37178.1 hypothetical protein CHH56_00095 [Terribacillus saccharophilus]PAD97274.1 hypothetical protein CHH50_00800 [Terribacillus saccharophilus]PAE01322.1 hypothetical protein CHH48_00790 [Terribacillus saccharophilus]